MGENMRDVELGIILKVFTILVLLFTFSENSWASSGRINHGTFLVTSSKAALDLNYDEKIDSLDLQIFAQSYSEQDDIADFNRDGEVNSDDYLGFFNAYLAYSSDNIGTTLSGCDGQSNVPVAMPAENPGDETPLPDTSSVGSPNDKGYEAQVIARWDVIPYQTFRNCITIGVVAFHTNGIERIAFSVNGGEWVNVYEPQLNDRTGVIEYNVNLNSHNFDDGLIEIRAVAFPKDAGVPRILSGPFEAEQGMDTDVTRLQKGHYSAFLYANSNHSFDPLELFVDPTLENGGGSGTVENPFATIRQAWEKIIAENIQNQPIDITLTKPGVYAIAKPRNGRFDNMLHWITIKPDEDISRIEVSLQSGEDVTRNYPLDQNVISVEPLTVRPFVNMLKFSNLSIDKSRFPVFPGGLFYNDNLTSWMDKVYVHQSGGWGDTDAGNFMRSIGGAAFVTDSLGKDSLYCFADKLIVRDSHCEKISGDVFQNSLLVLNNTVNHVNGSILDHHSDLFQYFANSCTGGVENVINYGVFFENVINTQNVLYNCGDEGFEDLAFVNIFVENINNSVVQNQPDPTDHLFIMNFGNPGVNWTFRGGDRTEDGALQTNLHMTNNVFSIVNMPDEDVNEPIQNVSHNHIMQGSEDFPNNLTQGVVFPAKNLERGAYGFGGPGKEALNTSGADLHNVFLRDHEGTLPRGPVSIFEPCNNDSRPVALLAADPLQIGMGQFIKSGDSVDFYSNASYACSGDIRRYMWLLDRKHYLGSDETITVSFDVDSADVLTAPFTVQIPPLYEHDNNGRCTLIDGVDLSILSKFFVEDPDQFTVGQTIQLSAALAMPAPLDSKTIYEVAEKGHDYIRVRILGMDNILEIKHQPFQCREDTEEDRAFYNSSTYYVQTLTVETREIGLIVSDTHIKYDWNMRPISIVGTSEPGIVAHYDFEFPVDTEGDVSIVDVSGQANHGLWNTGFQDQSLGHYSDDVENQLGRSAVFNDDFADFTGDSIKTSHIEMPAETIFGLDNFTLSFWMKKDAPYEEAIDFIYRHPNMLRISNLSDGKTTVSFKTYDKDTGIEQEALLETETATDEWIHIAITYDGSDALLYLNGQEVDRQAGLSGSFRVENDYMGWPIQIGAAPWVNNDNYRSKSFSGMLDDFKVYSKALSEFDGVN